MAEAVQFYTQLLGFRVSDTNDLTARVTSAEQLARMGDPKIYFTRFGSDHHTFIFSSPVLFEVLGFPRPPRLNIAQISWQVSSLQEVVNGHEWLRTQDVRLMRAGRDVPGSNWNTYFADPLGHPNELYYGMEQIGWSGCSKPRQMYATYRDIAQLPQPPEEQEVNAALAAGVDLASGTRPTETLPLQYNVGGILMARPFKITGFGPIRLFTPDLEATLHFYRDCLGLTVTEEVSWRGHRCVFLRAGSEHHCLALYQDGVAAELGLKADSYSLSLGCRVNDYRQLRDAVKFLSDQGRRIVYLPAEITAGIDYSAFVVDPDGHLIELYYYMEQIGWDGRPRPAAQRRKVVPGEWPEIIEPQLDTFSDMPFNGPWA